MFGLSNLKRIVLPAVRYDQWRTGQIQIPGAREEIVRLVSQPPAWEAVDISDLDRAPLDARLAVSSDTRSDPPAMFRWSVSKGMRPVNLCEAAAIVRAMISEGSVPNLVCLGSLWLIGGDYYYAGWQQGELRLYPFARRFDSDHLCPITPILRPLKHLPEVEVKLTA